MSHRITLRPVITPLLATICTLAGFYFTWLVPHANIMQWTQIVLAFGIIALGTCLNVPLGRTNDISYGVYIYAWPVQQILVLLGSVSLGISVNIILDAIITFGLAWLSWTFVEKRAMALARNPLVLGKKPTVQSAT